MAFKIVGIDENNKFPERVETRLNADFLGRDVAEAEFASKAIETEVTTGRLSEDSLTAEFAENAFRGPVLTSHVRKQKTGVNSTFTYDVYRINTHGRFIPRLVRKEFANDYQAEGTTGANFKPTRESLLSAARRLGATGVFSCGGYRTSGNLNEIYGAQIRNGIAYHDMSTADNRNAESMGFFADGTVKMYSARRGDTVADMVADGIVDSFSYGPILIEDGATTNLESDAYWTTWNTEISARAILGISATGDIIIINTDGVTGSSGLRGNDIVTLAYEEGCHNAIGLDGGGSVQSVISGNLVHPSSDVSGTRDMPDFIVVSAPTGQNATTGRRPLSVNAGLTGEATYEVKNGMVNIRGALSGPVPAGAADFVSGIPEIFRPNFNARGSVYFSGGYVGGSYVGDSGNVGIAQQTGASRNNPQFQVVYPVKYDV